jgi:hypothetical protein
MTWRDEIETSSVLKARHINEASRDLSFGINGQLTTNTETVPAEKNSPYLNKGIFTSREVFKPDFFGSPSPRMVAETGVSVYRSQDQDWSAGAVFSPNSTGTGPVGIPGLSGSIRLREPSMVNIMASFYCFEFGGVTHPREALADGQTPAEMGKNSSIAGYESRRAGKAYLVVDDNPKVQTERHIFTSLVGSRSWIPEAATELGTSGSYGRMFFNNGGQILLPMIGRHQHCIHLQTSLSAGLHHIGVCFEGSPQIDEPSYSAINYWYASDNAYQFIFGHTRDQRIKLPTHKNVFFLSRNFIVDAYAIQDRY